MIRRHGWFLIAAVLWAASGPGVGTAAADVQVNTYSTSGQVFPSVGLDADGDFVVVWSSFGSSGTDSNGFSIQGQRYASDGSATGSEFQVNAYTTRDQSKPVVALDADGDFVVVWQGNGSSGTDTSYQSIHGQRYASNGAAVGGEFQVNTYTTGYQLKPSVALDADGDFVVVWESLGSAGTDSSGYSIQGRRYASDGSTVGGEFQVNGYTTGHQENPSVSLDADGDFVIVWDSAGSSGTDSSLLAVRGQRYASDGSAVGAELQVNTYTTNNQREPVVGLDTDGDFVVVWNSDGSSGTDSSDRSIQGQRYASDGSAVGGEFQVNTYTTGLQREVSLGVDAAGDFVVVWQSQGSSGTDTDSGSIQSRRYASNGSTVGAELQVNFLTTSNQAIPWVSSDATGGFVVVWQGAVSSGTDSDGSIQKTDPGFVPVELVGFTVE